MFENVFLVSLPFPIFSALHSGFCFVHAFVVIVLVADPAWILPLELQCPFLIRDRRSIVVGWKSAFHFQLGVKFLELFVACFSHSYFFGIFFICPSRHFLSRPGECSANSFCRRSHCSKGCRDDHADRLSKTFDFCLYGIGHAMHNLSEGIQRDSKCFFHRSSKKTEDQFSGFDRMENLTEYFSDRRRHDVDGLSKYFKRECDNLLGCDIGCFGKTFSKGRQRFYDKCIGC